MISREEITNPDAPVKTGFLAIYNGEKRIFSNQLDSIDDTQKPEKEEDVKNLNKALFYAIIILVALTLNGVLVLIIKFFLNFSSAVAKEMNFLTDIQKKKIKEKVQRRFPYRPVDW